VPQKQGSICSTVITLQQKRDIHLERKLDGRRFELIKAVIKKKE